MAETYEKYLKNQSCAKPERRTTMEQQIDAAVDQAELLRDVYRRVEAFVEGYEASIAPEVKAAQEAREKGREALAGSILHDCQTIETVSRAEGLDAGRARLFLDDLKILLDQMPEGYKTE